MLGVRGRRSLLQMNNKWWGESAAEENDLLAFQSATKSVVATAIVARKGEYN
jgi:hypothetical protein